MGEGLDIATVPVKEKTRYAELRRRFEEKFGVPPVFYGRAPGRVNLIGEHIDYCGYAVLPMAIEQDIVIATAPNKDGPTLQLANTDSKYVDFTCRIVDISIDRQSPLWYNYFLCGLRGILERCELTSGVDTGVLAMVDGCVPQCAGLSSSSALVCAAAVVSMHCYGQQLTRLELAELCQHCERYIGTEGGGMDQAIAFLAQNGTAKLIEFNPVRATDVALPAGAVFVISNCCVELNKAATSHFNTRVAECRLGSQVMARSKDIAWRDVKRPCDLQRHLAASLEDMVTMVTNTLHDGTYSKTEICDILQVAPHELDATSLSEKTLKLTDFRLRDRALHVYSEAKRVVDFRRVCESPPEGTLVAMGQLMSRSHESCRDLYQCSCHDLDELAELALKSGSLGSRLTGAGWGGCVVSLVPANHVEAFMNSLRQGYYAKNSYRQSRIADSLFATQPGNGAAIYVD